MAVNTHTAKNLLQDARVLRAKKLIREALAARQEKLLRPQPPDPARVSRYQQLVEEAGQLRGRPLYFPYLGSGVGKGPLVELADGSVKYDLISGIGVHVLGHSHPLLVEAGIDAALSDTLTQGNLQQNVGSVELARMILDGANRQDANLKHCFLTTSGAMANENALKIVFQKRNPAHRILAFQGCFAGRTTTLSHVTDRPDYREGLPSTVEVDYVPFLDPAAPKKSVEYAAIELRKHLQDHPGEYAVMIFELVLGEKGCYPGDAEFFKALMGILREHDVPIMVDEIQTFGRTTEMFAFQTYGLDEYVDVVTVGKLLQVCATLYTEEFNPRPGLLSQTFTACTSALFGARCILRELRDGGYFGEHGKIATLSEHFMKRLKQIESRYPEWMCGPYGIGAMMAFTPFDGEGDKVKRFVQALFNVGVIAFVAGKDPVRVRFLLPYGSLTGEDIDNVARLIEQTLADVGKTFNEDAS